MCKRLIFVMTFVFALGSTAHAALYLWNGSAGDGNWDTVLNWTVTDSLWTWPNEEFGDKMVNSDTIAIDILNGDAVTREGELAIQGAADGSTTAVLTVNGSSLTVNGDLETNDGEGHIIISGNATVNVGDDLELANQPNGVGTVDISGTATVTVVDDIDLGKKGVGTLNISGDATLHVPDELYIGDDEGSVGHMNISGNATVTVVDDIDVGDDGAGTLDVSGNATLNIVDTIKISENGGEGHMTVSGNATVNVDDDIEPGCSPNGLATCDISENATVNLGDDFELGVDPGSEGHLTISGNASVTCNDIFVGKNLESITSLTINGGEMIISGALRLGDSGGADIGQSRVFMNGGLLQAEALDPIMITDAMIVLSGGEFRINNASVSEAGMQQLITDGTIAPTGDYNIITDGAYTVLSGPSAPPEPTGVNIIWVSKTQDSDLDGVQDDQGFIDLLTAEGHTVDVRLDYWGELDLEPAKVDELNAADLVIVSRSTSSGDHDEGDEPALWNSVTSPIMLMSAYLVRTSRWLWLNTNDVNQVDAILMALDTTHPIFDGVTFEMGNMVIAYDNTVSGGLTTFPGTIDVGNGTLIAQTLGIDCAAIVEWDAGVEMYPGLGAIAGGPRMFFASGSHEEDAAGADVGPQGGNNLTADGEIMFRNAINYLLPAAPEPPAAGEIWLEAESADPMGASWLLYDDPTVSGGKHIGSEDGAGNDNDFAPGAEWFATYSFTAAGGDYKVVLRGLEAGSDSFWVRITTATSQTLEDPDQPGTGWVRYNGFDAPSGWAWDEVHSDDHDRQIVNWTLPAGANTLEIAKREDGVYLDAILITDDLALDQATLPNAIP